MGDIQELVTESEQKDDGGKQQKGNLIAVESTLEQGKKNIKHDQCQKKPILVYHISRFKIQQRLEKFCPWHFSFRQNAQLNDTQDQQYPNQRQENYLPDLFEMFFNV